MGRGVAVRTAVLFLVFCYAVRARAQDTTAREPVPMMFVNDEWERYTRVLQVGGDVRLYPWSVRAFSPLEIRQLTATSTAHPWSGERRDVQHTVGRLSVDAVPLRVQTIFNSRFPFGYNDGAVWAGRGVTTVIQGGAAVQAGPLSVVLAPLLFRAENSRFPLMATGMSGDLQYGDPIQDGGIDQPQRFGDKPYERLDPGNSTIRLDVGPAAIGFSTADQHWGPARDHPLLLGNNAPGFPHVFAGTSHPVDAWIAKLHGRVVWGKLYASRYTITRTTQPDRFTTGLVGVIQPRGVPGLEIGAARMFHILWSDSVLRWPNFTQTFTAIARDPSTHGADAGNQIASGFARWVFPEAGFEVYGEYAAEDYPINLRHMLVEPDQDAAYLVGFERVRKGAGDTRSVIRGEVVNSRLSPLQFVRTQTRMYVHGRVEQGHTSIGQVLGSEGVFGGGVSTLAYDRYSAGGRSTISWSRIMRAENRSLNTRMPDPEAADVMHTFGVDGVRFRGKLAVSYELTAVYELNRNFASNAFNLRAASGIQYAW